MLKTRTANLLDIVELLEDLPAYGVKRGEQGVVVEVFDDPDEGYILEFVNPSGSSSRLAYWVKAGQIKRVTPRKAQELEIVEVAEDLPEYGVKRGERGVVVTTFSEPDEAYDLEFVDESGAESRFAYSVKPEQIINLRAGAEDALRQGFGLFARGQLHEAEAQLRKAVEMEPSAQVLGEVIQSFESPGQFQELPALRFLVRTAPEYGAGRAVLAIAHMKYGVYQASQGKFELALDLFDGALGVAPPEEMVSRIRSDIAKAYTALGVSANEEGDYEKALTFMRSACEAELSVVSRYNLSLAYALFAEQFLTNRQFAEAAEFFERAIDAGFSNAEVLNNYAVALLCRGDLEAAMVELERALRLDPQNEGIQANLVKAKGFVPSAGDGVEPVEPAEAQPNFSVLGMPNKFQSQPPMELASYVAA
jgi:tetratricopeptide (TPR) repeat protein